MNLKCVKRLACVVAGCVSLVTGAEDGWRLSLGTSYRDFDRIDFKPFPLRNFSHVDPAAGAVGIQGYVNATFQDGSPNVPAAFTADRVQFPGLDSSAESWAPALGVEKTLCTRGSFVFGFVGNLQYHRVKADDSAGATQAAPGEFAAWNQNYNVLAGIIILPPPGPYYTNVGLVDARTSLMVENELELDLYVLDLGLKAAYWPKPAFNFYGAAGPSLTLSDLETEQVESGSWFPIPSTNDGGAYRESRSDSELKLILGGYVALGTEYRITECLGIAAEYRYDLTAEDAETAHAELDLESGSGQVRLIYSF